MDKEIKFNELSNLWHSPDEEPTPTPVDEEGYAKEGQVTPLLIITNEDAVIAAYSTHEKDIDNIDYWLFHDDDWEVYDPTIGEVKAWAYLNDILYGKQDL